jgi:hypothetical protein
MPGFGGVAQLGAHLLGRQKAVGSYPTTSTVSAYLEESMSTKVENAAELIATITPTTAADVVVILQELVDALKVGANAGDVYVAINTLKKKARGQIR